MFVTVDTGHRESIMHEMIPSYTYNNGGDWNTGSPTDYSFLAFFGQNTPLVWQRCAIVWCNASELSLCEGVKYTMAVHGLSRLCAGTPRPFPSSSLWRNSRDGGKVLGYAKLSRDLMAAFLVKGTIVTGEQ